MRKALCIAFTIFLYACSGREKLPEDILPPKKMEAIFWDIFRADELATQLKSNDSTKIPSLWHTQLYDKVFKLHDVSKAEFKKSFHFYQSRPDLLKPILESLSSRSDKTVKSD